MISKIYVNVKVPWILQSIVVALETNHYNSYRKLYGSNPGLTSSRREFLLDDNTI